MKTTKVRILVKATETGDFVAMGWRTEKDTYNDETHLQREIEDMEVHGEEALWTWVEAEVPIPSRKTVTGNAVSSFVREASNE